MDWQAEKEKLTKQIAGLETKRRDIEGKLAWERKALDAATATRAGIVAELADADASTQGWAESEIDKLDREIISRRRFIESHEGVLAKIAADAASLRNELAQVEATLAQQEHERAFEAWKAQIIQKLRTTRESLANARTDVGELNMLAARGVEKFGGQLSNFLPPLFDSFLIDEANPEQRGWKIATPWYRDVRIVISPMVKR